MANKFWKLDDVARAAADVFNQTLEAGGRSAAKPIVGYSRDDEIPENPPLIGGWTKDEIKAALDQGLVLPAKD